MEVRFAKLAVIINRVRGDGTAGREHILKESLGADYVAVLPDDDEIRRRSENGEPLCGIPPDNPVARILDDVLAFTGIAVKRGNGT
jgi:CO dehydrogenase nickel-insertion accessory protein CooC1